MGAIEPPYDQGRYIRPWETPIGQQYTPTAPDVGTMPTTNYLIPDYYPVTGPETTPIPVTDYSVPSVYPTTHTQDLYTFPNIDYSVPQVYPTTGPDYGIPVTSYSVPDVYPTTGPENYNNIPYTDYSAPSVYPVTQEPPQVFDTPYGYPETAPDQPSMPSTYYETDNLDQLQRDYDWLDTVPTSTPSSSSTASSPANNSGLPDNIDLSHEGYGGGPMSVVNTPTPGQYNRNEYYFNMGTGHVEMLHDANREYGGADLGPGTPNMGQARRPQGDSGVSYRVVNPSRTTFSPEQAAFLQEWRDLMTTAEGRANASTWLEDHPNPFAGG